MCIESMINDLVLEWGEHPLDINGGECGDFACELARRLPAAYHVFCEAALNLFTIDNLEFDLNGHNMIEYDGRYYDAEAPQGVEYPELLPIFVRQWAPRILEQMPHSCGFPPQLAETLQRAIETILRTLTSDQLNAIVDSSNETPQRLDCLAFVEQQLNCSCGATDKMIGVVKNAAREVLRERPA